MDAFDADVLIYAAQPDHPLGRRVAALFPVAPVVKGGGVFGVGSVLLIPETTVKPASEGKAEVVDQLWRLLGRLELRPVTRETAKLATALGAKYGLRTADALHLATAVEVGADRFITNNERDFALTVSEVAITYPAHLPGPEGE